MEINKMENKARQNKNKLDINLLYKIKINK